MNNNSMVPPSSLSIPQVSIASTPRPGKRGPAGTSPPQNTSMVNTGTPQNSQVGLDSKMTPPTAQGMLPQKSALPAPQVPPQKSEVKMGSMVVRPTVQEMIKAAMAGASSRLDVSREASRQAENLGEKTASAQEAPVSKVAEYDQAMHLADAVEYIADAFAKEATIGEGPNTLEVSQAPGGTQPNQPRGKVTADSGMQSARGTDPASQLKNNIDSPPGGKGHQELSISGGKGKVASVKDRVASFAKNRVEDVKNVPKNLRRAKDVASEMRKHDVPSAIRKGQKSDLKEALTGAAKGIGTAAAPVAAAGGAALALRKKKEKTASILEAFQKEAKKVSVDESLVRDKGPGTKRLSTGEAVGAALLGGPGGYFGARKAREHGHKALHGGVAGAFGDAVGGQAGARLGAAAGKALGGHDLAGAIAGRVAGGYGGYKALTHSYGKDKEEPKSKKASMNDLAAALDAYVEKAAEDAINPAKISAGAAVPPDTSASGESGGAPVGGMPEGNTSLVSSIDSAINYTKGQAKAKSKEEMKAYTNEPALKDDGALAAAFSHAGEAGTKMSSVQGSVKTAAARALLSKLAEAASQN